jgi:hypothetical protein
MHVSSDSLVGMGFVRKSGCLAGAVGAWWGRAVRMGEGEEWRRLRGLRGCCGCSGCRGSRAPRTWMTCRAKAARIVGPWQAAGPAEGLGDARSVRWAGAIRVAQGEGDVGWGALGFLENRGWQPWSQPEKERSIGRQ